jgi:hypothetical protein
VASRTWPGQARAEGCGHAPPLTGQGGQAGVRAADGCRLSQAAEPGMGARVQARQSKWWHLGLEHDHAAWSLWSLMARWTGLEGADELTVRMGRGPSAAQQGGE